MGHCARAADRSWRWSARTSRWEGVMALVPLPYEHDHRRGFVVIQFALGVTPPTDEAMRDLATRHGAKFRSTHATYIDDHSALFDVRLRDWSDERTDGLVAGLRSMGVTPTKWWWREHDE